MFQIRQNGAQTQADGMRGLTTQHFEGFVLTALAFHGQFGGEHQQQLAQLESEGAFEQVRLPACHSVQGQQKFLLQAAFTRIPATGAADECRDCAASERLAQAGFRAVTAPHHHGFLAGEQVDQRILELRVNEVEHPGTAAHHIPVLLLEAAAVDLLGQGP